MSNVRYGVMRLGLTMEMTRGPFSLLNPGTLGDFNPRKLKARVLAFTPGFTRRSVGT